jgi:hypothetical protein
MNIQKYINDTKTMRYDENLILCRVKRPCANRDHCHLNGNEKVCRLVDFSAKRKT